MARTATTFDAFNAVAEPKRRRVLEVLSRREMPVNDLVSELGWPQPMVSKHLGVLKQVGLVTSREAGRQRVYAMNAEPLKAVHDWTSRFEQFWTRHVDAIQRRAEAKARAAAKPSPTKEKP
jgi:DNA-binding transcriptional ArsR family regulator